MISLQDKVVIITGGGRGIGFGLSTAFAKAGAKIVITGRTESTLLSAKESLEKDYGCEVLCVAADGADEAAMQKAFPYLKETKGCVVNFASGAGLFGRIAQSSYAAAKEGIRGLSRVAATEWAPYGVRVNVICPLAMTEGLKKFKEEYPDRYEQTIKGVPMGRFADPEQDVGGMCVFLCSDLASYVTGETITLQGGSGLRP